MKNNLHIIIAAGGSGERFGSNKLLEKINNIPIFIYSIKTFLRIVQNSNITLVCNKKNFNDFEKLLKEFNINIKIIIGGKTRTESIYNGLKTIDNNCNFVGIHDAARPMIDENTITKCYKLAIKHGASAPGKFLTDTIKIIKNGFIIDTIDRTALVAIETPQIFEIETLLKGYKNVIKNNISITDDVAIYEIMNKKVFLYENKSYNKKITYKDDLLEFENMRL